MKTPPVERAASRRRLAKKGQARPDGSFPIPNVAYLKKAIQAYGRANDKAGAKAHIISRAKALGRTDLLPDSWGSSSNTQKKKKVTAIDRSDVTAILLAHYKKGHSSRIHPGLDRSPKENWVDKAGGLPQYIRRIAKHIHYDSGLSISHAIAAAVERVKVLCAKGNAEACAAVADWNRKRAQTRVKATEVRGRPLTDLEFAEILAKKILLVGRGVGASGSNRPFDEAKYMRDPTTGKFSSKFTPAEMIAGHRIVEAGIVNLQVGQMFRLPNNGGWVQRLEGGYLIQGPAGIRVTARTASDAIQAASNIMMGALSRVGETKK
jgi:hypothetical protein